MSKIKMSSWGIIIRAVIAVATALLGILGRQDHSQDDPPTTHVTAG